MWLDLIILLLALTLGYVFRIYFRGKECIIRRDISNKIILITGGSKGIGQETIRQLANHNCTIIFGSRTKPTEFLNQLNKYHPKTTIKYIPLDLQNWKSIQQFVEQVNKEVKKIDILINNAAIMGTLTRQLTQYGLEAQFGTNYFGPFYLTQQLLPLLKKSDSPRVINVASVAHTYEGLDFNDINCDKWANSIFWSRIYTYRAYGNTKLSLILNAQEFSKRTGIKACSLHPGVVRSEVLQYQLSAKWFDWLLKILWPFFAYFTKDCYYGCQTTLHCIMMSDDQLVDGGYYDNCELSQPKYTSKQRAQQLWDFTLELIKKVEQEQK
ncbi:unnamed protein product [Paramecium pentaurelia]|uniref:Uncharacterized protein n=1 Tax=Paramecium pentaurelia TaxID=43138 RepID=A0A8S1X5U8_9CILI|nr:unnamed protein product [Paramecium pentaurelia]